MNAAADVALAKVNDQTALQSSQAKVCEHLRLKNWVPLHHGFVINQHKFFDLHIQSQRFAKHATLVFDPDRKLTVDVQSAQPQLLFQCFFINVLNKYWTSKFSVHLDC